MSSEVLERRFAEIGARLRVAPGPWRGRPRIDVSGRTFRLWFARGGGEVDLEVVDARPKWRHLLLMARVDGEKSKFLCGHDEREWFVAAVPESARGVTGVATAMGALQPELVRGSRTWIRQGEWFFVPAAGIDPPRLQVLRKEPLTRGAGSTPHVLEEAYRRGGEVVYVNRRGQVTSEARYAKRTAEQRRDDPRWPMVRDPELYARGAVRHPDHATVHLSGWHRVLMNTEGSARAMQHVMFLD